MRRAIASLTVGLVAAFAFPAHASDAVLSAAGSVTLPSSGNPIIFGAVNACDPSSPIQGLGGFSIRVPAAARGRAYVLSGPAGTLPKNDLDIVWLHGPQGISCVGDGYDNGNGESSLMVQYGKVPLTADWAFIVLQSGLNSTFTFEVS